MKNNLIYLGVLIDVKVNFDYIKDIPKVAFVYQVYIDVNTTCKVVDYIPIYKCKDYLKGSFRKLDNLIRLYNLNFIRNNYRNEFTIVNSCKCLIGTKVAIKQRIYKGKPIYNIVSTERGIGNDLVDNLINLYKGGENYGK